MFGFSKKAANTNPALQAELDALLAPTAKNAEEAAWDAAFAAATEQQQVQKQAVALAATASTLEEAEWDAAFFAAISQ